MKNGPFGPPPEWERLQDPIRREQVIGEVSSDMIGSVADASRVRGRREEQEPGVLDGAGGQDKDAPGDGKLVPGQRLHRDAADPRGARRDVEPGHAAVKENLQSRLLQFVTVRETQSSFCPHFRIALHGHEAGLSLRPPLFPDCRRFPENLRGAYVVGTQLVAAKRPRSAGDTLARPENMVVDDDGVTAPVIGRATELAKP